MMEAVVVAEQAVDEVTRSVYELEWGKPRPNKNHSRLQIRLGAEIFVRYSDQYDVRSEQSLGALNPPLVPDLSIFPAEAPNWLQDEVKESDVPLTVVEIISPS